MKPTKLEAVGSLLGNYNELGYDPDTDTMSYYNNQTPPTKEEIDTELSRLQAEYDSQEYARKRQAEYPTIQELVVGLYDLDDKADIEAKRAEVKKKYPKP